MKDTFEKKKESMKKLRFLKEYGGQDYINQLKSTEVRMTIKTKLNMLPVKDNYGESRVRCRLCTETPETTQHIINCRQIKGGREQIDIRTEDLSKLREIAKRAKVVEEKLKTQ